VLPENLSEDFMAVLCQYYSLVIIFKYTVVSSIPILRTHLRSS